MKIPLRDTVWNLVGRFVVGRTQTRHPNVRKALKLSLLPEVISIGDISRPREGVAFLSAENDGMHMAKILLGGQPHVAWHGWRLQR
jgi:hypothetical protein